MSEFKWLPDQRHDENREITVLHVDFRDTRYTVEYSDEAQEDGITLDRCKTIAERKIRAAPGVKRVAVENTDK